LQSSRLHGQNGYPYEDGCNRKVVMLVSHCPHALDLVPNSWIVVIMNIL
jgi:hypothetical protein